MTQPVQFLYTVPIGAVIAWSPPGSGAPLPPAFAFCDGAIVKDPDSPFDGLSVPDLRNQFVLGTAPGTTALGTMTGASSTNLAGPMNSAPFGTGATTADDSDVQINGIVQDHTPNRDWRFVLHPDDGLLDGNHHHVVGPNTVRIAPPGSIALYYIIRIK